MKVLILSCNTGEGHNYAGRALKECIESHHDTADMLDIMMQEGRNDFSLYERIVKFVEKYLQVFTNTSEMVKMMLFYEQAQAYVAMHSSKGEKMFLDMLKTYRDKTEVVLHYGLAYIDDDVEKTLRIFKKYESLLDEESDSYEIIRQIQRDEQEG